MFPYPPPNSSTLKNASLKDCWLVCTTGNKSLEKQTRVFGYIVFLSFNWKLTLIELNSFDSGGMLDNPVM